MRNRVTTALLAAALMASAAPARADILGTVGDVLKKGGQKAVELFTKGKETVSSWFGSADPKKVPYLLEKLQASQAKVHEKQAALLGLYGQGTSAGAGKAIADSYMQERVHDLLQAREENDKYFADLQELLSKLSEKKTDLTPYKAGLDSVHANQTNLEKEYARLKTYITRFLPVPTATTTAAAGTKNDTSATLTDSQLAARFNDARDPYAAAGQGKSAEGNDVAIGGEARPGAPADTGSVTPSYAPDLAGQKTAAPDPSRVTSLVDEWLASKGLDPFGRLLSPGITASGNPDMGGRSREDYLMANIPELAQYVNSRLGGADAAAPATVGVASAASRQETPAAPSSTAAAKSASYSALQDAIKGGDAAAIKAAYETYQATDGANAEAVSAGTAAR